MNYLSRLAIVILLIGTNNLFGQKIDLTDAIQRANIFLVSSQKTTGQISDSTNELFNVWETIIASNALLEVDAIANKNTVINSLNYLQGILNPQGFVCHNSACKDSICLETTALFLELCVNLGQGLDVVSKLEILANMQDEEGFWEIRNPDVWEAKNFVSVTAFMVNLFESNHFNLYNKTAALNYIVSQQKVDGSWGQTWEYYNCPGYAFWQCLKALRNEVVYINSYQKGIDFILNQQLENGSWFFSSPEIANTTSPELQTALMLNALLGDTSQTSEVAIEKGIEYLLLSQLPNGSWDGGFFPIKNVRYKKREYLFATSLAMQCLNHYSLKKAE